MSARDLSGSDIDAVQIRTHRGGDIGYVSYRHGVLYGREYGFDLTFDMYVTRSLLEFLEKYNPKADRLWLAEYNGVTVGSIGIVETAPGSAQLRWFLVEPEFRGRGLGRRLMDCAMEFCRERPYGHVYLWTFDALHAATHLYRSYGFRPAENVEHDIWGQHLVEQRWDLHR